MALRLEDLACSFGSVEDTINISFHGVCVKIVWEILGCHMVRYTSIGYHNIQASKVFGCLEDCCFDGFRISHIGLICLALDVVLRSQFSCNLRSRLGCGICDSHLGIPSVRLLSPRLQKYSTDICSRLCQRSGHLQSDATSTACKQIKPLVYVQACWFREKD